MRYIVYYGQKGSARITVEGEGHEGAARALKVMVQVFGLRTSGRIIQGVCATSPESKHDDQRMWELQGTTIGNDVIHLQAFEDPAPCGTSTPCDCIHDPEDHDPVSGACLYTNPRVGPCPCSATPTETRMALEKVFVKIREAMRGC